MTVPRKAVLKADMRNKGSGYHVPAEIDDNPKVKKQTADFVTLAISAVFSSLMSIFQLNPHFGWVKYARGV